MAHKSWCHAAAVLPCAVIMTYILTAGGKKKYVGHLLTIHYQLKCSQPCAKHVQKQIKCSVSQCLSGGEAEAHDSGRIPGCHTLPLLPWIISIGLSWRHLTHDRHRPPLLFFPGEHIWQPADLTDSLTHTQTNWLTDRWSSSQGLQYNTDDKQRGQTSCRWKAHGRNGRDWHMANCLVCLESGRGCCTPETGAICDPFDILPHCRSSSPNLGSQK